jgi:hypothetical protein
MSAARVAGGKGGEEPLDQLRGAVRPPAEDCVVTGVGELDQCRSREQLPTSRASAVGELTLSRSPLSTSAGIDGN